MLPAKDTGLPLWRTVVPLDPLRPALMPDRGIITIGSCFAAEIGGRLARFHFNALTNPFGTLFHPAAAAYLFDITLGIAPGVIAGFVERDGFCVHPAYHSQLNAYDPASLQHKTTAAHETLRTALSHAEWLIWTWGTALGYHISGSDDPVANCHKLPSELFKSRRWQVAEIVRRVSATLNLMLERYPQLHILLTVSPVRYLRETAHGNNLSKSVLLLAAEELTNMFRGRVHYFAAYELLLDELRDYRWYADDMLHPSAQAIDYIWHRLTHVWCEPATLDFIAETEKLNKLLSHRPLFSNDRHNQNLSHAIEQYRSKYPFVEIAFP